MAKKTIRDLEVKGKRALVRADLNVPLSKDGKIADDTRIVASLPTIKYLLENGAAVVLMSHLGRPDGKVVDKLRLDPIAERLSELLGKKVIKVGDVVGPEAKAAAARLRPGEILLLENVRFRPEEEANDPGFARELAGLGDFFVNDAFGTAHRAHASTAGVADYLPAVAGFLMEREISFLGKALENPERPFVALIGGAKVSTKIGVLDNLLTKVDRLLIGGAMANTLMRAQGYDTGRSLVEEDKVDLAKRLLDEGDEKLLLPVDVVVADKAEEGATTRVVAASEVPADMMVVDIGPQTMDLYGDVLANSRTVIWNGPMGIFEIPAFAKGTRAMAEALAHSEATSIVGGGDSVAALEQLGLTDRVTHVSTGGGASLEFLEGKPLPGVEVLQNV